MPLVNNKFNNDNAFKSLTTQPFQFLEFLGGGSFFVGGDANSNPKSRSSITSDEFMLNSAIHKAVGFTVPGRSTVCLALFLKVSISCEWERSPDGLSWPFQPPARSFVNSAVSVRRGAYTPLDPKSQVLNEKFIYLIK